MRYLFFYSLLLTYGFILFCYIVPRDYHKFAKLSPLTSLIQALLFFMYGGFPYLFLKRDWPDVSVPPIIHICGVSLVFIGLSFLFYGILRLGLSNSMGLGSPKIEKSGIYSLTRNPQAIACGLYVIGFSILWPSWQIVGWALLYGLLIHMMVLAEEKHLNYLHGQNYEEYCKRVPRYFGRK